MENDLSIAKTILSQLGGSGRLGAMIGAKDFVGASSGLSFRWTARAKNGANRVSINLDADDLYWVVFYSVRGGKVTPKEDVTGVYAENLIPLFENVTGLALRL